jgi:hypothetical protein
MEIKMERMIGRTPVSIKQDGEEILFTFSDGSTALFYHAQNCCESVEIEDVNGDWNDLIGNPILVADERISRDERGEYDTNTWTFYTFRGNGGTVDVRWHGSSNGYYSESVNFLFNEAE